MNKKIIKKIIFSIVLSLTALFVYISEVEAKRTDCYLVNRWGRLTFTRCPGSEGATSRNSGNGTPSGNGIPGLFGRDPLRSYHFISTPSHTPGEPPTDSSSTTPGTPPSVDYYCEWLDSEEEILTGEIIEGEDWGEIFNSEANLLFRNRYCAVYCREEIELYYPNLPKTLEQGRYMTINSGTGNPNDIGPIRHRVSTVCRTTSRPSGINQSISSLYSQLEGGGSGDRGPSINHSGGQTGRIAYDIFLRDLIHWNWEYARRYDELQQAKREIEHCEATIEQNIQISDDRDGPNATGNVRCRRESCCPSDCENGSTCEITYDAGGRHIGSPGSGNSCCCDTGWRQLHNTRTFVGAYAERPFPSVHNRTINHGIMTRDEFSCRAFGIGNHCGNTCNQPVNSLNSVSCDVARTLAVNALRDNCRDLLDYCIGNQSFNHARNQREEAINQINACNNFSYDNDDYHPRVTFIYQDEIYQPNHILQYEIDRFEYTGYFTGGSAIDGSADSETNTEGTLTTSTSQAGDGSTTTRNLWNCTAHGNTSYDRGPYTSGGCTLRNATRTWGSNTWVEHVTVREYDFRLRPCTFRYVLKPSGESVHPWDIFNNYDPVTCEGSGGLRPSILPNISFEKMDSDNLPIHFSTNVSCANCPNSLYRYTIKTEISSTPLGGFEEGDDSSTITTPTIFSVEHNCLILINPRETIVGLPPDTGNPIPPNTHFWEDRIDLSTQLTHDCPTCDPPGGLNVIYRPISLFNPFPGFTGQGRVSGRNWGKSTIVGGTVQHSDLVNEFIFNNRDQQTYDVFRNLDPMYVIDLNPGLMRAIRTYNRQQSTEFVRYYGIGSGTRPNRTWEGAGGFSDFTLTCTQDRHGNNVPHGSRRCLSNFLRGTRPDGASAFMINRVAGCAMNPATGNCRIHGRDDPW